ncbi:UNVERIFIED_CONTAM: hypothetical protein K2H54_004832, partial [Gekko kuhli]
MKEPKLKTNTRDLRMKQGLYHHFREAGHFTTDCPGAMGWSALAKDLRKKKGTPLRKGLAKPKAQRVLQFKVIEESSSSTSAEDEPAGTVILNYHLDYNVGEEKSSKNLIGSATNAILNMVNIAANILGAKSEEHPTDQVENESVPENTTATSRVVPNLLEPTTTPPLELVASEIPQTEKEPLLVDVTKDSPIVQLVQEYEEEASRSTVTLLPSEEQEEEMLWFESETQIYCYELMTVCCISTFSEYLYKRCSAIVALHRYNSKKEPPETTVGILSSVSTEPVINQTEGAFELEPSHPQAVSQSILLDVTTGAKSQSTMDVSSEPTRNEAVSETPEAPPQEEIPAEKDEVVGSVTEKLPGTSVVAEVEETGEERTSIETVSKPTETITQSECTGAVESSDGETKAGSLETEKPVASPVVESSSSEIKDDDSVVEEPFLPIPVSGGLPRTATDFYAELQNSTDLSYANGNLVHGSNQKESVFMRLNNRIKALEVNMSLSSRYLEELSQRYRKQMDEMQKAFNKTIIKLQNTSHLAEQQDLKQTEAIQLLQAQLTNMTQLVANLSSTVAELKIE